MRTNQKHIANTVRVSVHFTDPDVVLPEGPAALAIYIEDATQKLAQLEAWMVSRSIPYDTVKLAATLSTAFMNIPESAIEALQASEWVRSVLIERDIPMDLLDSA